MEEYDDLSMGPNQDGHFNLSYNDWKIIPYDLCNKYSTKLIYLNISQNNISEITDQIGSLTLLKELNLSHNALTKIDSAIGRCIRLRKMDVSHNMLVSIPVELLKQCRLLDSLQLQNNKIKHLPNEICGLHALEHLDVRNNNIETLPTKLHSIQCLKSILCQGNDEMIMIPRAMREDSSLVLWSLKLHQSFYDKILKANVDYNKLEEVNKSVLIQELFLQERKIQLRLNVTELERERPIEYIQKKESCLACLRKYKMYFEKCIRTLRSKVGFV